MSKLVNFGIFTVAIAILLQYFVGVSKLQQYYSYSLSSKRVATQTCVTGNCLKPFFSCLTDLSCLKTLGCVVECGVTEPENREAACAYLCEMTHGYENEPFLDLIMCMVKQKCLGDYPRDGICYGNDKDGVKTIDTLHKIEGDWWVIRGLNCGEDPYPGGYDWYPCQHERFIYQPDKNQWINNVTYCGGKDNTCNTDFIVTIANVSLPFPGVVKHEYTDAPLAPQEESWRIVSWPEQGDYLLMLWCGRLPILEYNGGIVLSRKRNELEMPAKVRDEFRAVAKSFGLDYDKFCVSDNTWCPV